MKTLIQRSQYEIIAVEKKVSNIEKDTKNTLSIGTSVSENGVKTTVNSKSYVTKTIYFNNNEGYIKTSDFPVNIGDDILLIYAKAKTDANFSKWVNVHSTGSGNYEVNTNFKEEVLLAVKNKTNNTIYYYDSIERYFKDNFKLIHVNLIAPLIFTVIFVLLSLFLFIQKKYFLSVPATVIAIISFIFLIKNLFRYLLKKDQIIKKADLANLVRETDNLIKSL